MAMNIAFSIDELLILKWPAKCRPHTYANSEIKFNIGPLVASVSHTVLCILIEIYLINAQNDTDANWMVLCWANAATFLTTKILEYAPETLHTGRPEMFRIVWGLCPHWFIVDFEHLHHSAKCAEKNCFYFGFLNDLLSVFKSAKNPQTIWILREYPELITDERSWKKLK